MMVWSWREEVGTAPLVHSIFLVVVGMPFLAPSLIDVMSHDREQSGQLL